MAHRKTLTDTQTSLLQWIADGSPPGVVTGDSYKISAAALARRDLIRIKGRGASWRADVTEAGLKYLAAAKREDAPPPRQGNVSVTEELISQVEGAGGELVLARDPRPWGIDYAKRAMAAIRYGKVPAGKRLSVRATWDQVELRLVDHDDEGTESTPIPVPARLTKPHPVIAATREAAKGLKATADGRLDIGREAGILHLHVSRSLLGRALRIGQAMFDEAERRGYEVRDVESSYNHAAGVGISVDGHVYAMKISELTDRVPLSEADLAKWRKDNEYRLRWRLGGDEPQPPTTKAQANGRLQLSLEHSYGSGRRSNWSEGPRVGALEARMPDVFRELADRAVEDTEHAKRLRLERERRESERQREIERRSQVEIDNERMHRLITGASNWRRAEDVRSYLTALRNRLDELDLRERDRLRAWIEWGESRVESLDPVVHTELIQGLESRGDGLR